MLIIGQQAIRAQNINSSVQGTVLDTSGAMVSGADITLTNVGKGVVLKTQSDASGSYSFPALQPGLYSLEFSRQGFATYKLSQFNLIVGQHASENANLGIASTAQTVTVEANGLANLLETESNDLGSVIGPQSVSQLPLNGRNFLQLGLLSGATQATSGAANASIGQTGHSGMSINISGNEPDFTMYLINGIQTFGSRAGNSSLNVSVSAIDQFEVHYGFFMPDMGPNPGIVDVVTKGGTNKLHGEAYEFVRTNQMEGRGYFDITPAGVPIAPGPYHQNQFGASVGGPIFKNKLFYFGNYEGYRQNKTTYSTALTPTQAMFNGDFSALSTPIYDPTTYDATTGLRQQFPNNKITTINPAAKQLLAFYLPGASGVTGNNLGGNVSATVKSDQITSRIDFNPKDSHQLFAQGSWLNSPVTSPGLFPSQGTAFPLDTELVALGWTWELSSTKVNSLRMGMVRDSVYDQGRSVPGIQTKVGITGTADPDGVPGIGIAGYAGFGTSTGLLGDIDNIYQIHDSFNWLLGKHQVKLGGDLSYVRSVQSSANANARGVFNFNNVFSAQTALNTTTGKVSQVANTGNAFADFLLGDLTSGQSIGMPKTHYRWTTFEPYIQDTWKLRPDLTVNLALAWYANTPPNPSDETNRNLIHGFDFTSGLETFAKLGTANPKVWNMTTTNFAPRIGFSWQPWFAKQTVVRAGWGMYYTTQMDITAQYSIVSQYITVNNSVSNATSAPNPTYVLGVNAMPVVPVAGITSTQVSSITGAIQYLAANMKPPAISQWNLDIQRSFGKAYTLDVAYIGNQSHHLQKNWDPWDGSSPGVQTYNPHGSPWPQYTYMQEVNSIGNGSYNAMLVKLQRQFTNGLSLMANYTWSKGLSDATEGSNGTLNQNKSCFRCDWGMTTSNIPQSIVISAVWELPLGRGKQFGANMNWALDTLAGGWSVDAIATMQKGNPFWVSAPNNTNWSPANIKADRTCNGRNELQNKDVRSNGHYWINKGCFVNPATDPANTSGSAWFYGNSGFDILTGPGVNNWDTGVHKTFPIHDSIRFVLRGEFFNTWNHAQFSNPSNGVTAGNFGQITGTQHDPREVQIGGTLSF